MNSDFLRCGEIGVFCFTGGSSCKAKTLRRDAHAAQVVAWLLMQPRVSARVPLAELFVLFSRKEFCLQNPLLHILIFFRNQQFHRQTVLQPPTLDCFFHVHTKIDIGQNLFPGKLLRLRYRFAHHKRLNFQL